MNRLAILLIVIFPFALAGQGFKPQPTFSDQPVGEATLQVGNKFKPKANQAAGTKSISISSLNWSKPTLENDSKMVYKKEAGEKLLGRTEAEQATDLLGQILDEKRIPKADHSFSKINERNSATGKHSFWQQNYKGLPIFGAEVKVHKPGDTEIWTLGRIEKVKSNLVIDPSVDSEMALTNIKSILGEEIGWQDLTSSQLKFVPNGKQSESKLLIYVDDQGDAHLAWHFTLQPNVRHRWEVFVDAHNGSIIHQFASHCQLWSGAHDTSCSADGHEHKHELNGPIKKVETSDILLGPVTANALDLFNINRTINVYQEGSAFYMIDASRAMFNSGASNFPDDAQGVVWTLDGQNNSPENSNFQVSHVANNNNQWNSKISVSAHYNGGVAYEYFRTTHSRNSINGQGGNVISLINVTEPDGSGMDNAFWNGAYMFYGNGNQAFNSPLAKGLDVAGHELSHGVIQNEANLKYENQSGALNESFADIFGAMIDRDDWLIGEDISNPSVFPSGSMRNMQDPHNGGNSNNFYWQPKHMNEFVNLPNTQQGDFGGVHRNSGIPNHAYYLFANDVGKSMAEDVYYEVLANYLVSSSEFIDLRIAVVEVAGSMFGPNVQASAENAFDAVGIGAGPGNDFQQDDEINPGDEIILWADGSEIGFFFPDNSSTIISNTNQSSRPSITDDGSVIVFIDDANRIKIIEIDYDNINNPDEYFLEGNPQTIWRNIAISKDGSKLSLLTTNQDNGIIIYDVLNNISNTLELENPTTSDPNTGQTLSTGDVQYADVMEWDLSGEFVMYDAFNEVSGTFSNDISYWDIGLIKVWNNGSNSFDDGAITKLFNGLSEDESIGNPAWAKNSPYIIAFDYITTDFFGNAEYAILGTNLETGAIGTIFENSVLGYPSYSPADDAILFSAHNSYNDDLLGIAPLADDKISLGGMAQGLVAGPFWGVWFANGDRPLVGTNDLTLQSSWNIWPNPNDGQCNIEWKDYSPGVTVEFQLRDLMGRVLQSGRLTGISTPINLAEWPAGTYWLTLQDMEAQFGTKRIVKH